LYILLQIAIVSKIRNYSWITEYFVMPCIVGKNFSLKIEIFYGKSRI